MRLWLQWMSQVKDDPSLRIGLTYFIQSAISLKQYQFLEWVVAQNSSYVLVDHDTGMMIDDLWCECLMSRDLQLCNIFNILPKPKTLIYPRLHHWKINDGKHKTEVKITGSPFDIALWSHDLEWIRYVSQFSPPQPQLSLLNLIEYLSLPSSIACCPPWASNVGPMSPELILLLIQELSSLESPATIIPRNKVVKLLQQLSFESDDDFYIFCQTLFNITVHSSNKPNPEY
jgi:hypothetical protein